MTGTQHPTYVIRCVMDDHNPDTWEYIQAPDNATAIHMMHDYAESVYFFNPTKSQATFQVYRADKYDIESRTCIETYVHDIGECQIW